MKEGSFPHIRTATAWGHYERVARKGGKEVWWKESSKCSPHIRTATAWGHYERVARKGGKEVWWKESSKCSPVVFSLTPVWLLCTFNFTPLRAISINTCQLEPMY